MLEWMGLNFYYYDGLQPKIRAGIINEHECIDFVAEKVPKNFIWGIIYARKCSGQIYLLFYSEIPNSSQ